MPTAGSKKFVLMLCKILQYAICGLGVLHVFTCDLATEPLTWNPVSLSPFLFLFTYICLCGTHACIMYSCVWEHGYASTCEGQGLMSTVTLNHVLLYLLSKGLSLNPDLE